MLLTRRQVSWVFREFTGHAVINPLLKIENNTAVVAAAHVPAAQAQNCFAQTLVFSCQRLVFRMLAFQLSGGGIQVHLFDRWPAVRCVVNRKVLEDDRDGQGFWRWCCCCGVHFALRAARCAVRRAFCLARLAARLMGFVGLLRGWVVQPLSSGAVWVCVVAATTSPAASAASAAPLMA